MCVRRREEKVCHLSAARCSPESPVFIYNNRFSVAAPATWFAGGFDSDSSLVSVNHLSLSLTGGLLSGIFTGSDAIKLQYFAYCLCDLNVIKRAVNLTWRGEVCVCVCVCMCVFLVSGFPAIYSWCKFCPLAAPVLTVLLCFTLSWHSATSLWLVFVVKIFWCDSSSSIRLP